MEGLSALSLDALTSVAYGPEAILAALAVVRHTDSGGDVGATSTCVRASLSEVAAALAALTGEPSSPRHAGRVVIPWQL